MISIFSAHSHAIRELRLHQISGNHRLAPFHPFNAHTLIRRRTRKDPSRDASSHKVGQKLPMKHAVAQKRGLLCKSNGRPGRIAVYFAHLSNVKIAAVYDDCSCSIPKCPFHEQLFIAQWLSDNCLHFPFLIKVDLFIETKDCCGLEDD
jgi:hypothetical protein